MTLPAHIDWALREIGVVPSKREAPPPAPSPSPTGTWYPDGDIPF